MIPIKIDEILSVTKGKMLYQSKAFEVSSVCIDSRLAREGSLFIAIKGNKVDGHDFIEDALGRGAVAVLTERKVECNTDKTIIHVKDNLKAMHELTKYYRSLLELPIIALTGSSGKTTTKDIIYAVLKQKFHVHKTNGNQNNELGVPLTMFGIEEETEIAVIEMGMNHPGEISILVNMVLPDISVITNVGVSHMEYLGTQENIFKAKSEILDTLGVNQIALVNGDDPYLTTIENKKFQVIKFGLQKDNHNIYASNIESNASGLYFNVYYNGNKENYRFKFAGNHNVYNCLVAIYIGMHFELSHDQIQKGLDDYIPSNNRMDIRNIHDYMVINDSYNANPDAMKAALNVLIDYKPRNGRAIAIIGDMLEMGENTEKYHVEVGEYIAKSKEIDYLIAVGENAKYYTIGAQNRGMEETLVYHFTHNEMAGEFLKNMLRTDDVLLIKGSRGMVMEEILHILERS